MVNLSQLHRKKSLSQDSTIQKPIGEIKRRHHDRGIDEAIAFTRSISGCGRRQSLHSLQGDESKELHHHVATMQTPSHDSTAGQWTEEDSDSSVESSENSDSSEYESSNDLSSSADPYESGEDDVVTGLPGSFNNYSGPHCAATSSPLSPVDPQSETEDNEEDVITQCEPLLGKAVKDVEERWKAVQHVQQSLIPPSPANLHSRLFQAISQTFTEQWETLETEVMKIIENEIPMSKRKSKTINKQLKNLFSGVQEKVVDAAVQQLPSPHAHQQAMAEAAETLNVSIRQMKRIIDQSKSGSLSRRQGSGRPESAKKLEIWRHVESVLDESCGAVTGRALAEDAAKALSKGTSQSMVVRLLKKHQVKRQILRSNPILTAEHMQTRLKWCQAKLAQPTSSNTMEVHVDEKWFFAFKLNRRVYVLQGRQRPRSIIGSKQHIQKAMFFAAVAHPVPLHNFDGRVLFFPVVKYVTAQRDSKKRKKGDKYSKADSFTAETFKALVTEVVLQVAEKYTWVTNLIIQFDNAGGHGGGKGDMKKTVIPILDEFVRTDEELAAKLNGRPLQVTFDNQPARSPDLNVLDLGCWASLDCAVDAERRKNPLRELSHDQLMAACHDAWNNKWNATDVLSRLFDDLPGIYNAVIECQGKSTYKQPHSSHRKPKAQLFIAGNADQSPANDCQ